MEISKGNIKPIFGMILPCCFTDSRGRLSLQYRVGYDAFAMGICAAFSMFSINIPYPVVGSATHNQAKQVCKLACERVSADCSASVLLGKTRRIARPKYRSASKEYNVRYSSDELAVLNDTPTGASALCALGATHCVCLTANRRGAICGIRPDKRAYRYECS